jgi:RNA polymerase sigma-70 factor (ECF subfamily)
VSGVNVEQVDPSKGDSGTLSSDQRRDRFLIFYQSTYSDVYTFVLRRLRGSRDDATDVTAEIFTTAWRRRDQIPPPPEDRLWIYGVARRVVSRHQRSTLRRLRLLRRLGNEALVSEGSEGSSEAGNRERVRAAMARLRPADRDVLGLVLWEQLSHENAAKVLGCSVNAVALRLHRARKHLRREILISGDQQLGQDVPSTDEKGRLK